MNDGVTIPRDVWQGLLSLFAIAKEVGDDYPIFHKGFNCPANKALGRILRETEKCTEVMQAHADRRF